MDERAASAAVLLFFLLITLLSMAAFFGSIIWAYGDAERRNKSGCLVALLVFFFWPIGLLIWLIFRPEERERR